MTDNVERLWAGHCFSLFDRRIGGLRAIMGPMKGVCEGNEVAVDLTGIV